MKLPRWLDRELLLTAERVFAKEKAREARMWFEKWGAVSAELHVLRDRLATKELELTTVRAAAMADRIRTNERIEAERKHLIVGDPRPLPSRLAPPDDRTGLSDLPYPTKTRLKVFAEVVRREIRWHHFVTPEARNIVTDRVRTAAVKEMADAGIVDIGSADPGTYSVPEETAVGVRWAEGPGSTSPEPRPEAVA